MPKKKEQVTNEELTVTSAEVYNRHSRLVATYTKETHGAEFLDLAHQLASQPRRIGWKVITR